MSSRVKAGGNVIFVILIAIALFAALSFAATRGGRGGGSVDQHDTVFIANEIMRYGQSLADAVNMLISNGVRVNDISFQRAASDPYEHATVVDAHKVFHASGAGLEYRADIAWLDSAFSAKTLYGDWFFPAGVCLDEVGTGRADCESDTTGTMEEMIALLPYVSRPACLEINRRLGVPLCGGDACAIDTDLDAWNAAPFAGSFANDIVLNSAGGDFTGRREGCIQASDDSSGDFDGAYIYYKVLVAR